MSQEQENDLLFILNLTPETSKKGNIFYRGKLNGLTDLVGFVKDDGKIVVWAKPNKNPVERRIREEAQMNQHQRPQTALHAAAPIAAPRKSPITPRPQAEQKPQPKNYAPSSKQPAWDDQDPGPEGF